ncbi:acyltransferase family protein [Vibrio olivae]|uniref:Acyltransferase family protein n=1 Tax=Vibrio olivae TaxID=1243002 RepID=A0ABV5HSV4_9VIBR
MNFRYDINGLRAIAVIAVVLFHFNSALVPGGFAGVDVFFVISGFLMTGIIFRGIESHSFNLLKFYVARANRIIPALSVVCLCLLFYGWFFLSPKEYQEVAKHVTSSVFFVSNIIYWKESGYFDADSHFKWLLHTWSLSVEWQFYIVYPIVLVILKRFLSVDNVKRLIVVGALLSFVGGIVITMKMPDAAYYSFPTRAWEMMFGGIAFIYPITLAKSSKKRLEYLGLLMIVSCYWLISAETAWPGYLAIVPVLGTYFILVANRQDSVFTNNPVFQAIGKWSYSIYLWHWPIVVYGFFHIDNWSVIGVPLSLMMGWLSYRFVESKKFPSIQQWKRFFSIKPVWMSLGVAVCSVFVLSMNGLDTPYRVGATSLRAKFLDKYQHYDIDPSGLFNQCNTSVQIHLTGKVQVGDECISQKKGGVFVWGDSHMGALSTGLRHNLPSGVPFSQLTSSGCSPSFLIKRSGTTRSDIGCNYSNRIAYDAIMKTQPKVVILGARRFHESNDWLNTVDTLKGLGVDKVIIMGPFPQWSPSLPLVYFQKHYGEEFIQDDNFDNSVVKNNNYLKHILNNKFVFIDLLKSLCRTDEQGKLSCRAKVGDELIAFDYGHLTTDGSDFVVKNYVMDKLTPSLEPY